MEQRLKKFSKLLAKYTKLAVDTPCILYYIEKNPKYLKLTETIFEEFLPAGKIEIIASTLLLTEILIRPFAQNRPELVLDYKSIISKNITLYPPSEEIAERAAYLRAIYHLATPDAIHLATAIEENTSAIIGNDAKWKKVKEIKTILLDEFLK